MSEPILDLDAVEAWFTRLYGAMPEGEMINIVRTGDWAGSFVPVHDMTEIARTVLDYDSSEPVGVYHRITSVTSTPAPGPNGERRRGDVGMSSRLPGFWADLDIAGPGHKSKGELPVTEKDAVRIITNSNLPEPTLWVRSGGGLYPWWLLDEPYAIPEEKLSAVGRLSEDLHAEIRRSAREIGMEYAPMADLARVLRVPGTVNRKVDGSPTMCRVIKDGGPTYTMQDLRDMIPAVTRKVITKSARNTDLETIYNELPDGPQCRAMLRKQADVAKALSNTETGGRHAAALSAVGSLIWMGNVGHKGAREALDTAREIFNEIKDPSEQGPGEWDALVSYVLEKMEVIEDRHCCGEMTFTDAHLASRIVKEELRGLYIWAMGTGWLRWSGKVWAPVSDASMARAVSTWLIANYRDAVDMLRFAENTKAADEEVKAWKAAMSTNRINGLVSLARGLLEFDPALMDAEPDILNTPSGVVDLRTGELMDHDPARFISKITSVSYRPDAVDPDFDRVISAVPAYAQRWLQIKAGQAATGYAQIGDDPNVIAKGGGMNGKTTVMDTIGGALGSYAVKVPKEVLTGDKSTHEIMALWGARFALTEELPEGARLNTVRLKELTDTPHLQGRKLYKDMVTWTPTHSLFVTTNPLPQVAETTLAVWRRLALLIFPYVYVNEDRALEEHERRADPELRIKVRDKDPALMEAALRWVVDGARMFYEAGMRCPRPPEEVAHDTREWRKASDTVLAYWDEDRIIPSAGHYVTTEDLYKDYVEWTTARGNKPSSVKVFNPMFEEHQETVARRVTRSRPKTIPAGMEISRPDSAITDVPQRPTVWMGIKFASLKLDPIDSDDDPFAEMIVPVPAGASES